MPRLLSPEPPKKPVLDLLGPTLVSNLPPVVAKVLNWVVEVIVTALALLCLVGYVAFMITSGPRRSRFSPPPVTIAAAPLITVDAMYSHDEQQRKAEWQQIGQPLMIQFEELALDDAFTSQPGKSSSSNDQPSVNAAKREAAKQWLTQWGDLPLRWAHPHPRPWQGLESSASTGPTRRNYEALGTRIVRFIITSCIAREEFDAAERVRIARSTIAFTTLSIVGLSQAGERTKSLHEWHMQCDDAALCWLAGVSTPQATDVLRVVADLRSNWQETAPGTR